MPYKIIPIRGTHYYKVINLETREVKAKRTTLKKAKAQVRLLNGLEHGVTVRGTTGRSKQPSGVRTFPNLASIRRS